MKEISSFAGWSLLGSASSMIANYGQGIVINVFFGTIVNAAQSIAAQISGQLGVFSQTLTKALNPLIDKSEGAGNRSMMLKATLGGTKVSFFLLSFLYIPFLIKMPYILGLWLKNVPEFTVIFCRLLLIRNLIEQFYIPLTNALGAVGNIKKYQIANSVLNIIPIIVSYVFFSFGFPPHSLYIAFILFSLLMLFNVLYFAKANCDLHVIEFLKNIVFNCLIAFVLALLVSSIPIFVIDNEFIQFVMVCVVGCVSYLTAIWLFALTKEERVLVINLKNKMVLLANNLRVNNNKFKKE